MRNQEFIIAREGFRWIFLGLFLTAIMTFSKIFTLAFLFGLLTVFIVSFFRNPHRKIPETKDVIVSPADGTICMITDAYEKRFLKASKKRISIFMSPFNCHVNRIPWDSKVIQTYYHSGKFHFAKVDKASDLNEQYALLLEDDQKNQFVVVQIAGWLCRRIVNYVKIGDSLKRGERFGIIQFGSRVDIYLQDSVDICIKEGQKVKAGESIIGKLS